VLVLLAAGGVELDAARRTRRVRLPPFAHAPSLAAAAVVAAWATWGGRARRAGALTAGERGVLAAAGPLALLLWGRAELGRTGSPTGDVPRRRMVRARRDRRHPVRPLAPRRRGAPGGLALALYAAVKAIVQVSAIDPVGLRVGSFLLVGGFLLSVGFCTAPRAIVPAMPTAAGEPGGA
jgi:hypothetical protein